jgi:hypothetical protein
MCSNVSMTSTVDVICFLQWRRAVEAIFTVLHMAVTEVALSEKLGVRLKQPQCKRCTDFCVNVMLSGLGSSLATI